MAQAVMSNPRAAASTHTRARTEATGWAGFAAFAGVMMMIAGTLQAFYGVVALFNDEWVAWGNRGAVFFDLTTWGWVHLGVGVAVALAGVAIFSGNALARAVGVVLASLSILVNFLFLPAYPIWALVVIATDVLVIYALVVHGRELAS